MQIPFAELSVTAGTRQCSAVISPDVPLEALDGAPLPPAHWFLCVRSTLPWQALAQAVPLQLRLVVGGVSLAIVYYQRPPAALPQDDGREYFRIQANEAAWASLRATRTIYALIPGDLCITDLELHILYPGV